MVVNYYRFMAYRGKKLALNILLQDLDAMVKCVIAFQEFYDKISVTCYLTGSEVKDNDD